MMMPAVEIALRVAAAILIIGSMIGFKSDSDLSGNDTSASFMQLLGAFVLLFIASIFSDNRGENNVDWQFGFEPMLIMLVVVAVIGIGWVIASVVCAWRADSSAKRNELEERDNRILAMKYVLVESLKNMETNDPRRGRACMLLEHLLRSANIDLEDMEKDIQFVLTLNDGAILHVQNKNTECLFTP